MKWHNFLLIFAATGALSGYAAWLQAERHQTAPTFSEFASTSIPLIRKDAAEELWHDPATLFLDVRSSIDYDFGHIAGAISLPEEDFEKGFPDLKPRLERARVIVVYCKSLDCGKSLWAAIRLRNEGFTNVQIYPAGWNEWVTSELPTAGSGR
ncbi:MAG: rhodanese-like domain-containing protein [Gemmataceae bacterium]